MERRWPCQRDHVEEVAMLEGHMGGGGHVRGTMWRRWPC